MKTSRARIAFAFLILGALSLLAAPAAAIPSFARAYETTCATCHQAYPRLNGVGESFRVSGFRFVNDESYRKATPLEMGDEAYKRLWPEAMWPSSIPSHSPVSFIGRLMIEADLDGTRPSTFTYLMPEEVELVWAGNIGDNIAYYGDVIFLQKDFGGQAPDSWSTIKTWVQLQSLIGPDHHFNLRLGTVGTQTMGMMTARDANFYGTHFYLYTSWFMPDPILEEAGLSSFKGNNFTISPQGGLEVNGFGERWYYAVGLANPNPDVPFGQPPASDVSFVGMARGGESPNLYTQLAYKFGGTAFDRSGEERAETLTTGTEFWHDDSLLFSLWGYLGSAEIRETGPAGVVSLSDDDFWRLGLGVQKKVGDLSVSAAWVLGEDDDPYGTLSQESVESEAWHFEVLYQPYPWLLPYARYEGLTLDLPLDVPGLDPDQDQARVILGAKAMLRPNVSFTIEAASYTEGARLQEGFDETLFALFALSF